MRTVRESDNSEAMLGKDAHKQIIGSRLESNAHINKLFIWGFLLTIGLGGFQYGIIICCWNGPFFSY